MKCPDCKNPSMIPLGKDKKDGLKKWYCIYCGCVVKEKESEEE